MFRRDLARMFRLELSDMFRLELLDMFKLELQDMFKLEQEPTFRRLQAQCRLPTRLLMLHMTVELLLVLEILLGLRLGTGETDSAIGKNMAPMFDNSLHNIAVDVSTSNLWPSCGCSFIWMGCWLYGQRQLP